MKSMPSVTSKINKHTAFHYVSEICIHLRDIYLSHLCPGSGANSFSNDYLTQVKPISIHLLPRVGDKGTARVTFQQFLVAGALSALDVIDSVYVCVCVCLCGCVFMCVRGHPFAIRTSKYTEVVHLGFSAVAWFDGCHRGCVGVQQSHSP